MIESTTAAMELMNSTAVSVYLRCSQNNNSDHMNYSRRVIFFNRISKLYELQLQA